MEARATEGDFLASAVEVGSVESSVQLKAVCWTPHLQLGGFGSPGCGVKPRRCTEELSWSPSITSSQQRRTVLPFLGKSDKETVGFGTWDNKTGCEVTTLVLDLALREWPVSFPEAKWESKNSRRL